ncbi:restriction endonuclease subunit S [Ilyobacter polytropus]|uniref:restriction endonuclease subunit S n=1 Tax=Ilyobacter polytropus TaxID=167642 RepID=UPI001C9DE33F|nr:restriction endonuclease subunit S [Ilyobacter polytropus]
MEPKLRFPEFNGEWQNIKLKDSYTLISGQHLGPDEYSQEENKTPYFTGPSDFTNKTDEISKWSLVNGKLAQKHDVLFTVKGSGVGSLMYLNLESVMIGRQLMAIRSRISSTKLLSHFLPKKREYFEKLASGNMIPGLSREDILSLNLSLPTSPEQQKIASFLTSVDSKIEKLEKKRELMAEYKRGVMQKIFSQEIRFKGEDGKEYPEWVELPLGDLVIISKEKYNPLRDKEIYKCIELENLSQETGKLLGYFNSSQQQSIKNKFNKGDILYGKLRPYLKKYYKADFDGVCSSEILVLKGKKLDNNFLYQLIKTFKFNSIANVSSGSKMPRADWEYMKEILFKYPSILEQQKIANFLSGIDKKIELVEQETEQVKEFKRGLLQQMFV